jgi:dTDP-4-dehydrorhamnose reductase
MSLTDTRWLVVGAGGMLGRDVAAALDGRRLRTLTRADLDITSASEVASAVRDVDVVVNAAAWTGVDDAETAEDAAYAVNADGPRNLARACAETGARLVHVSTDYVFDGRATTPYVVDAPIAPASAYGRTKAAGEQAVRDEHASGSYVVRTAWLYGQHGPSFVRTMRRLADGGGEVRVVTDQVGQPTWTHEVAARIVEMVDIAVPTGTYHATASGRATWFDLARLVFELDGHDPARVLPTTTDAFPRPAPRPAFSVLDDVCWTDVGLDLLRPWDEALRQAWPVLPRT